MYLEFCPFKNKVLILNFKSGKNASQGLKIALNAKMAKSMACGNNIGTYHVKSLKKDSGSLCNA